MDQDERIAELEAQVAALETRVEEERAYTEVLETKIELEVQARTEKEIDTARAEGYADGAEGQYDLGFTDGWKAGREDVQKDMEKELAEKLTKMHTDMANTVEALIDEHWPDAGVMYVE